MYQVRWSLQIRHDLAGGNDIESKPEGRCFYSFAELAGDEEKDDNRLNRDQISAGINEANKRPVLRGAWLSLTNMFKKHFAVTCKLSLGLDR